MTASTTTPPDQPETPRTPPPMPAGPKARFPGELMWRLAKDRLPFFQELARKYGDVVPMRIAGQTIVLLRHPDDIQDLLVTHQKRFAKGRALERAKELIGDGLLTSEGSFHLRQRRLVQPAFHRARIAGYATEMASAAGTMRAQWQSGQTFDVNDAMMRLTLQVVAQTLFGARLEQEATAIGQALTHAFESFEFGFGLLATIRSRLPTKRRRRFLAARELLDDIIYRLIEERRRSGTDTGDLLSMLLMAQDDEGDGTGMSDLQLRDELLTLFIAGHETTANALSWAWLALARNPDAEAALHAEVDRVLGDRLPTADDLAQLPYTRAVMAEAMRLYPPAYIIGRRSLTSYEVGGVRFPTGTIFLCSQFLAHRDPRWWPEAERFLPERWLVPAEDRPKFAYFPFGAGTRICVGEQFAWMESTLMLATLAAWWRVRVDGPDPAFDPIFTLRPSGGLPVRLERRF
ncbi:MAG: cytochrome P450 [Gemmatimonadaceae bacterium]